MAETVRLVLVAACALLDGGGRVLVSERPAGKELAGLWEFPGGKVEPGEPPEQALVRELREELAIDVDSGDLVPFCFASHSYPTCHLLMPLVLCRRWRGEVTAMEGQRVAWTDLNHLTRLAMPPADLPLVAALARKGALS